MDRSLMLLRPRRSASFRVAKQLLAQLMRTMNAPLQNLVTRMNGVTQKLVRVLQAVADQKAGE